MEVRISEEEMFNVEGIDQAVVVHYDVSPLHDIFTTRHLHEYIEILYCDGGEFCISMDGKLYDFSKGDMVVINSMESHAITRKGKENGGYICLRFLPELLYTTSAAAFDMKYVMPFILSDAKHQRVFKVEEIKNTFIPELMKDTLDEYRNKNVGFELALRANISKIFLWIVRYWHETNLDISNEGMGDHEMIKRIGKVCEYVNSNYGDDIKASEMADMINLSYSYFSRIFKQYMKKSFSEYLSYVRITHAEKILASTDKSITDIAMKCGFSATSYFIKQFKQQKGISPKQYRNKLIN